MNIQHLSNLLTFILFSLWQPSLAQSINDLEVQKLLIENPINIKILPKDKTTMIKANF